MKKADNNRIFDIKDVGFTNLDGQFIAINFDQKDLANVLFTKAESIDMDNFARAIHKDGKAELTDQVEAELLAVVPMAYSYRVCEAIKETINKIK